MLALFDNVSDEELTRILDEQGDGFAQFVIDHGLGPLWHERMGGSDFHESRMNAEALYMVQTRALTDIDNALERAGVDYAVIKGAATRQFLYENPAIRACHDLDLLVRPEDKVRAASALAPAGFVPVPEGRNISRELVLGRSDVDIDLHWGLLREGRLRTDPTNDMLARRRRVGDTWVLSNEDTLFLLLVHPAFAKHLAGWDMGLHRVADIILWLPTQTTDWAKVREQLEQGGVRAAAWATWCWVELLAATNAREKRQPMLDDLAPGRMRRAWLDHWLNKDLSVRTAGTHWMRLLGLSLFLHDSPSDVLRALAGRWRARRRSSEDMEEFASLLGE